MDFSPVLQRVSMQKPVGSVPLFFYKMTMNPCSPDVERPARRHGTAGYVSSPFWLA